MKYVITALVWALAVAMFMVGWDIATVVARRGAHGQPMLQQVQPFNKRSA